MDRSTRSKKRKLQSAFLNIKYQSYDTRGKENHEIAEIPYLPIHIITEVLSRVVIKTLLSCRLVCKTWADLIYAPEFAKLHLSRSPTMCLMKFLYKKCQSKRLHLFDLECPFNKLVFMPKINLPNVPLGLIGSCNGLVCLGEIDLSDSDYCCKIFVCNPVLREYITLPDVTRFDLHHCAFGFNHTSNQYKVVMSLRDSATEIYKTLICTLGEGSWRILGNAEDKIHSYYYNAFLNGAFHWIDMGTSICCFDFLTEEYRAIPGPSESDVLPMSCLNDFQMHMSVINDNLAVYGYNYFGGGRLIIWVMKEYGVKESWSKDFVLTNMIYDTDWVTYEPIFVNGNGEILVICNRGSIVLYNPKSEAVKSELMILGRSSGFRAIAHVPSLISLKDVAQGDNIKVLG